MSARVEQAVALLREEYDALSAEALRLDDIVAERQKTLGEAAIHDQETLAIHDQVHRAYGGMGGIRRALAALAEHSEV